jgi:hypothetical protein
MMRFVFRVEMDVERSEGKFASREDVAAELLAELEGCNPGSLSVDEAEYEGGRGQRLVGRGGRRARRGGAAQEGPQAGRGSAQGVG